MSFGISIGDILKLLELANRVYKNCRDSTGEHKTLANEARSLTNILQDVADKVEGHSIPESKMESLKAVYEPCVEVLQELDETLNHYNSLDTRSKRAWNRLKWDAEKSSSTREKLMASVVMLNGFYTSLIHDSQVLILEALGRLESDYRGGYREESIASVEKMVSAVEDDAEDAEDAEDAAWPQIIRDLEDMGISAEDASEYRDFIIDFFIRAVNEGRFLEQARELTVFDTLSEDLNNALSAPSSSIQRMPSWETPRFPAPVIQRKPLATSRSRSPVISETPSIPDRSVELAPSSVSMLRRPSNQSTATSSDGSSAFPQISTRPSDISSTPSRTGNSSPTHSTSHQSFDLYSSPSGRPKRDPDTWQVRPILVSPTSLSSPPQPIEQASPVVVQQVQVPPAPVAQPTQNSPVVSPPPVTPLAAPPPAYEQHANSVDGNLFWTAQRIIAAWNKRDFVQAEKHLCDQLAAVERGETITLMGKTVQPDRRLLRHLIGVCNSYSGDFLKAKKFFESAFNGIYLCGPNIDDGDIAACRWLGDVCLHLNEFHNTALAWSIALEGLVNRYSIVRDMTRRVLDELHILETRHKGLKILAQSFSNNYDMSDIFMNSHSMEKSNVTMAAQERLKTVGPIGTLHAISYAEDMATNPKTYRPRAPWLLTSEAFLTQPLLLMSAWPLQWDPTFSPVDCMNLHLQMTRGPYAFAIAKGFCYDDVPSVGMMGARDLHYISKRDIRWLVPVVKNGLEEVGIQVKEHNKQLFCRVNQLRNGMALFEGIAIKFKKIQFRSAWGFKITDVQLATRGTPSHTISFANIEIFRDSSGFRDIVKTIVQRAEEEEVMKERRGNVPLPAFNLRRPPSQPQIKPMVSARPPSEPPVPPMPSMQPMYAPPPPPPQGYYEKAPLPPMDEAYQKPQPLPHGSYYQQSFPTPPPPQSYYQQSPPPSQPYYQQSPPIPQEYYQQPKSFQ
ncbi:hypothetical protein P154DRAFT_446813 [Amniculicola lignicola CBS 123094]|uniref:Fungal N-terminal domain-containing protein n=1 Tax=Amniculicola lignicola CBS 123094 TaxID=1392246 RepID=A0A6A5VYI2_9PLEO|nr:hypothetical protein P154DRAFT_446813 [Amniculicola lignicola CBS 123094]